MAKKLQLPLTGKVRILNALYPIQQIGITANEQHILFDTSSQDVSDYFLLPSGNTAISIFIGGTEILTKKVHIEAGKSCTLAVAGKKDTLELISIDNFPDVPLGETKIRFLHLSSDTPALDVAVKERDIVFPKVSYLQVTNYLGLTPMTVDLELRLSGSKHVIIPMPKLQFKADNAYTLALTDDKNKVLLLID